MNDERDSKHNQLLWLSHSLGECGYGAYTYPAHNPFTLSVLHSNIGGEIVTVTTCGNFYHFRDEFGKFATVEADRPRECAETLIGNFAGRRQGAEGHPECDPSSEQRSAA